MNNEKMSKKQDEFAVKLYSHLIKIFDEDEEMEDFIDLKEIGDNDEATELIYAISCMVPAMLYKRVTGEEIDILSFNHIANRLVHQFSKTIK